jgi:hypothetical protein
MTHMRLRQLQRHRDDGRRFEEETWSGTVGPTGCRGSSCCRRRGSSTQPSLDLASASAAHELDGQVFSYGRSGSPACHSLCVRLRPAIWHASSSAWSKSVSHR